MPLKLQYGSGLNEAGVDEAGRGCLAGPVVAAAVILPKRFRAKGLDDSKKMSAALREELRVTIMEKAIAWKVGIVSHERIDKINILNATFEAMKLAVEGLTVKPELLLIDGNRFVKNYPVPFRCEVKGDGRFLNIAAASVLAKTFRDDIMRELHEQFPAYNWIKNKGYGTLEHRRAILSAGVSPWHRLSFQLYKPLTLFEKV